MAGEPKIRIAIAEDYRILREGLRALLDLEPEFEVVAEAGDGPSAVQAANRFRPDLLLLDLSMPRMNGTEVILEVKRVRPSVRILVLTVHADEGRVHAALSAGADGYLLKNAGYEEMLLAIRSVLAGRPYLSPAVSRQVIDGYLEALSARRPSRLWGLLSKRERQVLKRIAEGEKNRQIAEALGISIKTVEKHRTNLMRKLDLHNAAALTTFAIEKGLVGRQGSSE